LGAAGWRPIPGIVAHIDPHIHGWDSLGDLLNQVSDGLLLLDREARIVRANRPARALLGRNGDACDPEILLDALTAGGPWRREQIREACRDGEALQIECDLALPAADRRRVAVRLTPLPHDLMAGWIRDLTQPRGMEQELHLRAAYQDASARILRACACERSPDDILGEALGIIGEARGVSRSYIFENDDERGLMTCTHEWVAPGIEAFRGLTAAHEDFPYWLTELRADRPILAGDVVEALPQELHEILSMQGILSILVVPLWVEGRLWGFVGLDECVARREWDPLELTLFRMFGELVAAVIAGAHTRTQSAGAAPCRLVLDHD
jgi:PAS domain-containing protein